MKIGLFGGSFNPIHYGHIFMANFVLDSFKLDKIIFIPSGISPHKKNILDEKERYNMVKLAIEGNEKFFVTDYETNKKTPSYTYETLYYIFENEKLLDEKNEYFYIIGKDAYFYLNTWYNYDKLKKMIKFIVVDRNFENISEFSKKSDVETLVLNTPRIEISSTDIRKRIRENKSIRYYVTDKVRDYILENNLYRG